jgi:predicted acetyltransferase
MSLAENIFEHAKEEITMGIELRKAAVTDGMDIYEMLQELPANENGFINSAAGMQFEEYKEWLKGKVLAAEQIGIVDGWKVPQSTFWLFEDSRPVGYGNLRHFLTEKLLEQGGNIGYSIRPSDRNRGLGKILLSLLIKESKKMGMDRLLITVNSQNTPSLHVALANGGKVERATAERNYVWITL